MPAWPSRGSRSPACSPRFRWGLRWDCLSGKQIGVLGCVALAVRLGWCRLPSGVAWFHVYGVALLTGIGFTMSLFFASLALGNATLAAGIRIGVIAGSLLSAGAGIAVLRFLAGRA